MKILMLAVLCAVSMARAAEDVVVAVPVQTPAAAAVTYTRSAEEIFASARGLYQTRNLADAFVLYSQAAAMGHAESQYMTGLMWSRGEGVPQASATEAVRYYTLAAEQGYAKAQYSLAMCYYQGLGAARDDALAYKWFYAASLKGDTRSVKMLAMAERSMRTEEKTSATAQLGD